MPTSVLVHHHHARVVRLNPDTVNADRKSDTTNHCSRDSDEPALTAGSRVARNGCPRARSARTRCTPWQRASTRGLFRDGSRGVPDSVLVHRQHAKMVRLKPDTTNEVRLIKPDTTNEEEVRLKPDATTSRSG